MIQRRYSTNWVVGGCLAIALLTGCADGRFNALGSSLLSSTGLVTGSQADTLLKAGEHVVKSAKGLTEEEEYYLGRGVAATVFSRYRPYANAEVTSYVNKVAAVVAAVSDRPETFGGYHVQLLDSSEINALSAPGGFIFLTTGFLKIVPDEEALAAVLAHEVAHIVKGHGVAAISEANLSEALMLIGKEAASSTGGAVVQQLTSAFGDSISDIANTILTKGYSRSQEYEADEYAVTLLKGSGYNAGGMIAMLESLERSSKGGGGWLSTHPEASDRKDEIGSVTPEQGDGQAIRARRFQSIRSKLG